MPRSRIFPDPYRRDDDPHWEPEDDVDTQREFRRGDDAQDTEEDDDGTDHSTFRTNQ